ncbi:MAG: hypothetical protein IPK12_16665 [Gemmatimonadetes bacterium]|nr:hypothetical protein [Gemmatimonadota bacterium]
MASTTWTRLRRAVAARGFTPASWIPAASEGRAEEATIRPARLVEQGEVGGIAVGLAEPWPDPVAFLDGMQRYEVMAYAGASPVVVAEVAGAVLERHDRQLHAALAARRRLVIARPAVLADLGDAIEDHQAIPLPEDGPPHPVHDFLLARREVDAARGRLEVELGHSFRARSDAWLIVDGTLTESPQWAADGRMLGVCKSHATLPFADTDLEQYLRLPVGHRSPVFQPAGHDVAPVWSWALRLWPWEGRDLLHGLVRIEAAPRDETLAQVDQLSRWLIAERSPVSTPDPRWDRLLYGIRAVEQYLRASGER